MSINHISNVILFADDTSVLATNDNCYNFKQKANLDLIKWFQANQRFKYWKTNIVKFTPKNSLHARMATEYANKLINETIRTRFLGMQINNHINCKKHIP